MKKENVNVALWVSGLLAGVLVGTYLYRNQDEFAPQKKKIKSLIGDLKNIAADLGSKALKVGQEHLEASKDAALKAVEYGNKALKAGQDQLDSAKNTVYESSKDAAYKAAESVKKTI